MNNLNFGSNQWGSGNSGVYGGYQNPYNNGTSNWSGASTRSPGNFSAQASSMAGLMESLNQVFSGFQSFNQPVAQDQARSKVMAAKGG